MASVTYGQLSNPVFGCTTEVGIIVDSNSLTASVELNELPDEDGEIVAAATHGGKQEVTIDFTVKATGFPAEAIAGATIVVAGNNAATYIVTEVVNTYTKADWLKGSVKGIKYAGISLTG